MSFNRPARNFIAPPVRIAEGCDPITPPAALLSAREGECLRLVAIGLTDEATASAMHITRATVRFHLKNSCRKLGAVNRCAAIYRATKFHLI